MSVTSPVQTAWMGESHAVHEAMGHRREGNLAYSERGAA